MAEKDKKKGAPPKDKQPEAPKAPGKQLPDLSNKALMDDLEALAKQIGEANDDRKIDMAAKMIELSIQAVKTEDKRTSLAAYKTLKSIQGEITALAFQNEDEQKRFQALYGEALKSAEKSSSMLGVIAHDLADSGKKMLPTLSSFGKQLMSNTHPALKIAYDIAKETKDYLGDAKKRNEEANKEGQQAALTEAEVLLQQSKAAEQQVDLVEKQEELIDAQQEALKEEKEERAKAGKARKEGPLVQRMEAVRANTEAQIGLLETLLQIVQGGSPLTAAANDADGGKPVLKLVEASPEKPEPQEQKLKPVAKEAANDSKSPSDSDVIQRLDGIEDALEVGHESTSDMLDRLEQQIGELNHANVTLEKLDDSQQQAIKMQQDAAQRQEMLALKALEDNKDRPNEKAGFLERMKPKDDKGGGLLGMVGDLLGSALGVGAPKIISAMLGPLSKIAGPALKAVPVVGTVIAGVTALFDFFDGFNNAGEILGKDEVNLFDKVSAGIGSVLGGLTSIIDFTAGLFGFETGFAPKVKEHVSKFLAAIPEFITETFDQVVGILGDAKDAVMGKVEEVWDTVTGIFDDLLEFIPKMLLEAIPGAKLAKKGYEAVKGWLSDEPPKENANAALTPVPAPTRMETIRDQEQATESAEAKAAEDTKKASTVNAPITNNTRVDASSTSVYNQPLSSRNNDRSNWAGMGSGTKMV